MSKENIEKAKAIAENITKLIEEQVPISDWPMSAVSHVVQHIVVEHVINELYGCGLFTANKPKDQAKLLTMIGLDLIRVAIKAQAAMANGEFPGQTVYTAPTGDGESPN